MVPPVETTVFVNFLHWGDLHTNLHGIYGGLKAGNNTSNQVPEIITAGSAQRNVTNSLGHIR